MGTPSALLAPGELPVLGAEVCRGSAGCHLLISSSLPWGLPGSCRDVTLQSATAELTIAHLTELRITLPWLYVNEINPLEEGGTWFIGFLEVTFYYKTASINPPAYLFNWFSILTKFSISY